MAKRKRNPREYIAVEVSEAAMGSEGSREVRDAFIDALQEELEEAFPDAEVHVSGAIQDSTRVEAGDDSYSSKLWDSQIGPAGELAAEVDVIQEELFQNSDEWWPDEENPAEPTRAEASTIISGAIDAALAAVDQGVDPTDAARDGEMWAADVEAVEDELERDLEPYELRALKKAWVEALELIAEHGEDIDLEAEMSYRVDALHDEQLDEAYADSGD